MPNNEEVYDPEQDLQEKRAVRRGYRGIQQNLNRDHTGNDISLEELANNVQLADKLFEQVKGPSEATLDSDILVRTSTYTASKARAMKSGSGAFDVDEFLGRLVTFMGGRQNVPVPDDSDDEAQYQDDDPPLDWERLGRRVLAKSRRVPAMDFMLGPLSIEQKKRTMAKRAKLEKNKAEERKPQEITEEDITRSENETTKNVATLERILEDQDGEINLFKLIVNPNDFGQSVENLFYLSFLIRDGKCAMEIKDNGDPKIFACLPPSVEDIDAGLRKRQLVMEFDMATWRRAIEVFNITESLIPQRPKAEMRIGQKWYG